jgi:CRP-like cAMP-binding protein
MDLAAFFKSSIPNSLDLADKVDAIFNREVHQKGTILLRPEKFSTKLFFIEKGLIRTYYLKDGKDITHIFFDENSFSGPIDCIYFNRPSLYGWEVLEESTIRVANYKDFESNMLNIDGMDNFARMVLINNVRQTSDRLYAIQFQTAESRYKYMMEEHPNILLRAPLGHIASYLGITQQTLSVIRGRKL